MAAKITVSSYLKNVGKSFGYAIGDTFSKYNPVITDIIKESKETTTELYESIKSFTSESKSSLAEKDLKNNNATGIIKTTFNNLKDDLKTGNWYNKARKESFETGIGMAIMGIDMDDFGFDGEDWGDFDFGSDFSDEGNATAKAVVAANDASAKQIISAVDEVGYKMSTAVGEATIESANYIVQSARMSDKALYDLNKRGFSSINESLLALNKSISGLTTIAEPLTTHMQNSGLFFTRTTETLNKIEQSLVQIAKNTTPAPSAINNNYGKTTGTLSDVLDDGRISIKAYINMIKTNFKDDKDLYDMAMNMVRKFRTSGGDGGGISLGALGISWLTDIMIPKTFKKSMENFNENLKYSLTAGILKARDRASNSVFGSFFDMLFPKDTFKTKINRSNYNKGPVAWDGIARHALVEVLPKSILKIYEALTGKSTVYDYDQGKFIERSSVEKQFDKTKMNYAKSAGGEFRDELIKAVEKSDMSEESKAAYKKGYDDFFLYAFMEGGDISKLRNPANRTKIKEKYGVSDRIIDSVIKFIDNNSGMSYINKFYVDKETERNRFTNFMKSEEASGHSIYGNLNDGFNKKIVSLQSDYNKASLYYLKGIYENTLGGYGGKKGKGKRKGKRSTDTEFDKLAETILNPEAATQTTEEAEVLEELEDAIENERVEGRTGVEFIDSIISKIRNMGVRDVISSPFNIVGSMMDGLSSAMTKMIWGDPDNPDSGVIQIIINKTKEGMSNFVNFIKDEIAPSLKDKFKNIFDKLFGEKDKDGNRSGGFFSDFVNDTKSNLKDVGLWFKKHTDTIGFGKGAASIIYNNTNNAAKKSNGKKVTKSGINAVSKGELIVPSELNPFYNEIANKNQQVSNESGFNNGLVEAFSNINIPGRVRRRGKGYQICQSDGSWIKIDKAEGEKLLKEQEELQDDKEQLKNLYDSRVNVKQNAIKNAIRNGEGLFGKANQMMKEVWQKTKTFGTNAINYGKDKVSKAQEKINQAQENKEKKTIADLAKSMLEDAGDKKGAIGAGALIGAGVSAVTGAALGPLFGAAIGGAVGLTIKSKNVQNVLFGEDDENGDPKGALLSANVSKFIKKNVPAMAAGGALGAAGGLFMGSPVLGAILGSTVGFVSSSEKAKEWIFGKVGEDGEKIKDGIIPKELQDAIKKGAPNIAIGALAGLAAGPFGVFGNLVMGAGLGYLTTSENFRDYMFGNEEKGIEGLTSKVQDKIFNKLDELFHNFTNMLKGFGKNLFESIGNKVSDFIKGKAKAGRDKLAGTAIGKALEFGSKKLGQLGHGIVDTIGMPLDFLNTQQRLLNLRKGYDVYNREAGRNMFAAERITARGGKTSSKMGSYDNWLANASAEDIKLVKRSLETVKNPNRTRKTSINDTMSKFYEAVADSLDVKNATKLGKLIERGKFDQARRLGEQLNVDNNIIEEAIKGIESANDVKGTSQKVIQELAAKGIKVNNFKDANNMLGLINTEMNNTDKFKSEEAKKEEEVSEWRKTISDYLDQITSAVTGDDTGKKGKKKRGKGKRSVYNPNTGQVVQLTENSQGEEEPDMSDKETKKSQEIIEDMNNGFKSLPLIGPGIEKITGFFGDMKNKLFGDGTEENKGFFGKLFDSLKGGTDSKALSWIGNLISKTKIGSTFSKMFSGVALKSIPISLLGTGLLIAGFSGLFDDIAKKLTGGAYGDKESRTILYNTDTGEPVYQDENGNYVDANGNPVSNVGTRIGGNATLSEKLMQNTARGVLTGSGSIASVAMRKPMNLIKTVGSNIGIGNTFNKTYEMNMLFNEGDKIGATLAGLSDEIFEACTKFTRALSKVPVLKKLVPYMDDMAVKLAQKISSAAAKQSVKTIANVASNAVIYAKIAFIIIDFTSGYEDARSTLGIVKDPTVGQRIVSGLLRALKNLIPIVGSFIPDEIVIDVFCEFVGPALGIAPDELLKDRAEAQATVDAYNTEHGTDYDITEYNKSVLKDYTWTERTWNAVKSTGADIKNDFSNMVTGIKEKGFGGFLKDAAAGFINDYKTAFQESDGNIIDTLAIGTSKTWGKLLPGVLGEIAQKYTEMSRLMWKGDLAGIWKLELSDFAGGGEIGEDGVETAVPGLFSKIFGQIPLISQKLSVTVPALLIWLIKQGGKLLGFGDNKEGNIFTPIFDGLNKGFKFTDIFGLVKEGDVKGVINYSPASEDDSPITKIFKNIPTTITKFYAVPMSIATWVGKKIGKFISKTINTVKTGVEVVKQEYEYGESLLHNPDSDFKDFFKFENEDPENPINGFTKTAVVIARLSSIPVAIFKKVSKSIGEYIGGTFGRVKNSIKTTFTNNLDFAKIASQGDVKGIWQHELIEDSENPVGGFTKVIHFINKIGYTLPAGLVWVGRKIGKFINKTINTVKTGIEVAKREYEYGESLLNNPDSDFKDFFKFENEDPENPIGGATKAAVVIARLSSIPVAIFKKVGKGVGKFIGNAFGKVKNSIKTTFTNNLDMAKLALQGDVEGVWKHELIEDPENPVGGFTKAIHFTNRIAYTIPAGMVWAGKKVGGFIGNAFGKVKNSIKTTFTNNLDFARLALQGDVKGIWQHELIEDPENPVGGFTKAIHFANKIAYTIPAGISWAGHKVADFAIKTAGVVKSSVSNIATNNVELSKFVKDGDIKGLWGHEFVEDEENPINGFLKIIHFGNKLSFSIPTLISSAGHKISDFIKPRIDAIKDDAATYKTSLDALKELAKNGDVENINKFEVAFSEDNPVSKLFGIGIGLSKMFFTVAGIFNNMIKPITDIIDQIKSGVSGLVEKGWDKFKGWVTGDSEESEPAGGASGMRGFVSQLDPRYKNMKMGNSTVGELGCGPAVASMIANSYGKNLSMEDAVSEANGFINKEGTTADYFGKVLSKRGIGTNYMKGGNIKQQILHSLSLGQPVILLGSDKSNTSKDKSPFGPNNHYIAAVGLDKAGNIIVTDPESNSPKTYSKSILDKANIGISTNAGGSGSNNYDSEIAKQAWAYFIGEGYSPAATAGILGNLYAESGMNPKQFQDGGPAAGIAQWENYKNKSGRWANLNSFASNMGKDWTDLDAQLRFIHHELPGLNEYFQKDIPYGNGIVGSTLTNAGAVPTTYEQWRNSTDVDMATRQFEGAFERAGKPHMDRRLAAAAEYYKLYHDSNYVYDPSSVSSNTTEETNSGNGVFDILGAISTAFGKIGNLFNFGSSNESTSETGGITPTVVDGVTGPGNQTQKALAEKLLGIKGQLNYSMEGPRDPNQGSADCSSTVNWAYKQVTGTDIGNSTLAILRNNNLETIDMASGVDVTNGTKSSSGPNIDKLMPGDLLLYSRPDSNYSSGREYRVGHVEMYVGNGQRIGHGGGMGPKVSEATKDAKRYIMARRLKGITSGAGSGLSKYSDYTLSGGSSGVLLSARPGSMTRGSLNESSKAYAGRSRNYSGGASYINDQTTSMLNNVKNTVAERSASGGISPELAQKLIQSIINVLNSIANNTASIGEIYKVLVAYTSGNAAATKAATEVAKRHNNQSSDVDSNIVNLVGTLAEIARG